MARPRRAAPAAAPAAAADARGPSRLLGALALAALLVAAATIQVLAMRDLKALPSALFGGDLYYQAGCIRSIEAARDPMASCSVSGALPGYLPLYGTLVALLSAVTPLDVVASMLLGSLLFTLVSLFVLHRIGATLAARTADAPAWLAGLGLAALWYATHHGLILRYTDFAGAIVVPLFLAALWFYLERPSARRAVPLGLAIAVAGYTHAVAFTGAVAITALCLAVNLARGEGGDPLAARLPGRIRDAAIVAGLSLLALGYWHRPLFQYGGKTSLHYTEWNGGPSLATSGERLAYAADSLRVLFRVDSPAQAVTTVLFLIGVALLIRRRARPAVGALGLAAAATLAYGFHYFVTEPLFGMHLVPDYVRLLFWECVRVLVAALALAAALARFGAAGRLAAPALAALLVAGAAFSAAGLRDDPALIRARTPLHPMYRSLQRWVAANTQPDDVFLSSNELSFALSALTGRKVMVTRRAQNDAFIDMDVRNRDAALILYGGDDAQRNRLLAEYRVRYLLWTAEWPSTEFYVDERGRVVDYDDPLLYFENAAYDAELERAGVRFTHQLGWVDPALRGPNYRKFPLTIVTPDNYTRADRPWRPQLDASLEPVWSHEDGGRTIAALYRVR